LSVQIKSRHVAPPLEKFSALSGKVFDAIIAVYEKRINMPSTKQRSAARKNIKKAAAAAKRKQTLKHLPKSTRTALGKQANKVKRQKSRS
jgi:hypothetical protein